MNTKQMKRQWRPRARLFFTGLSMGAADLVPGVSGGTIALLYGIYDELLYSIRTVTGKVPHLLLRGKVKEAFNVIPFGFLLPLSIGIVTAVFGLVQIFSYLLDEFPVAVWSTFFGLVLGCCYIISKRVNGWNKNRIGLLVTGFAVTFLLMGLPVIASASNNFLFISGMIASSAMILPGISGSLILVMIGQYETVINAVADRDIPTLVVFAAGAVIGLAALARILGWLLHNYHSAVIATMIGVMLGSLRKVWPWQVETVSGLQGNVLPEATWLTAVGILMMCIGFLIVWKLEKIGIAREHVDISDPEYKQEVRTQHD